MNKLRFYLACVRRHAKYGSKRDALGFAVRHWRVWHGAEPSDKPYTHIGS